MDTEMPAARWPWTLLWAVVLIALIATVSIAAHLIAVHRHERNARRRNPGVCFYLDDDAVEYLYVSNTGSRSGTGSKASTAPRTRRKSGSQRRTGRL